MNLVEMVLIFYRKLVSGDYTWADMLILISDILREISKLLPDGMVGLADAQAEVGGLTENQCLAKLVLLEESVLAMDGEEAPQFDITPFIPIILRLIELWLARRGS